MPEPGIDLHQEKPKVRTFLLILVFHMICEAYANHVILYIFYIVKNFRTQRTESKTKNDEVLLRLSTKLWATSK